MPSTEPSPTADARAWVPNALTLARVALAAGVIVALALYDHPAGPTRALPTAGGLFILAALTDALDGHLARRWGVVSRFGRVMDPFADKALILGSFVMLAGPNFAGADGRPVTGVEPWMVVLLLARELLVTSIRGVMEGAGVEFGANRSGKAKMILQSVAAPAILALIWLGPRDALLDPAPRVRGVILTVVWLTVVVTVMSGAPYVWAAGRTGPSGRA